MSEALICISLPTESGISIYSAKILSFPHFYIQTIQESEFDVTLCINDEAEKIPMKYLTEKMSIDDNMDKMACFRKLYGNDFHTSKFNIFELIEEGFQTVYGKKIDQSNIYQKYNQLNNKIISVERQVDTILASLNLNSRKKIENKKMKSIPNDCRKLLKDPITNEKEINETMDLYLLNHRNLLVEQKDDLDKLEEEFKKESIKKEKEKMTINKNKFGQFVHLKYNMVFDPKTFEFIGMCNGMGGMNMLNVPMMDLCKSKGWKYRLQGTF